MIWNIEYTKEAEKDLSSLSNNQQIAVVKAIKRVGQNPLPQSEGGYGKPLGHKHSSNLTGFLKIKLRKEGIRVVYRLVRTKTQMQIIVIGIREDDEVYEIAARRAKKI